MPDEFPWRGGVTDELAPNVISFDITYYDGLFEKSEWIKEKSLPEMVAISIIMEDPKAPEEVISFYKMITLNYK